MSGFTTGARGHHRAKHVHLLLSIGWCVCMRWRSLKSCSRVPLVLLQPYSNAHTPCVAPRLTSWDGCICSAFGAGGRSFYSHPSL